ncbi:hypothetical protein SDC9_199049 [bioreactor metagenome]|uniref:Uncharacterized protein n=1 Tax=bioreactor metagenome TaxID=1076179 RepID=A0A645ISP8_9ZZZZ
MEHITCTSSIHRMNEIGWKLLNIPVYYGQTAGLPTRGDQDFGMNRIFNFQQSCPAIRIAGQAAGESFAGNQDVCHPHQLPIFPVVRVHRRAVQRDQHAALSGNRSSGQRVVIPGVVQMQNRCL